MATKEELLEDITFLSSQGLLTKEEMLAAYSESTGVNSDTSSIVQTEPDENKKPKSMDVGIPEILSYLGGGIVFIGIATLVAQNWETMNSITRMLITWGAGIAAYIIGVMLSNKEKTENVSMAFHVIAAMVLPIALFVLFDTLSFNLAESGTQSIIFAILLALYASSYIVFKKTVFSLFGVAFGTWLFFSSTNLLFKGLVESVWQFTEYRIMFVGVIYILMGYLFSKTRNFALANSLYGFGSLGVLASGFILCGWSPNQSILWEIIFPILVATALYLSVVLRSTSFLVFGTMFLMIYILRITSEYFSSSLGWPITLIIAGLAMIGVGYLSFNFKQKYFGKSKTTQLNQAN